MGGRRGEDVDVFGVGWEERFLSFWGDQDSGFRILVIGRFSNRFY